MIEDRDKILAQLASEERYMLDWDETPYVACDEPCFARRNPVTIEEYKRALEHWKNCSYLKGCSHGS